MTTKTVHFSYDWNFLATIVLEKEGSALLESKDKKSKKLYQYIWSDFSQKQETGYDFSKDLDVYLSNTLHHNPNIPVTTEILQGFAQYWWKMMVKKFEKSKEYVHYLWDCCESGVWNQETNQIIPCDFGAHWHTIEQELLKRFGESFVNHEENYPTLDAWIEKNIRLKGTYMPKGNYTRSNNRGEICPEEIKEEKGE